MGTGWRRAAALPSARVQAVGSTPIPNRIGAEMLFHVTWAFKETGEEGARRSLALLAKWQPPAGAEFQGFYGFADGNGGVALIEADSAATVARTTSPWTPWLRFTVTPIVPIEESSAIGGEAIAFRDSVA
jgi:Protein of unknown function (DUF3303)